MKNKIFIFVVAFLLIILSGCSADKKEGVAVTVYDNDIMVADIKTEAKNSKSVYEKNTEQINNLDISAQEKTKMLEKIGKPKKYNEILNEKIERVVLLHEAEKLGLTVKFDDCKNEAEKVFLKLNSVSQNDYENYRTLLETKNYMAVNNLSDEEYIEYLANLYYENARINLLKNYFKDNLCVNSKLSFEQQYSDYTEKLINDAKIVRYN